MLVLHRPQSQSPSRGMPRDETPEILDRRGMPRDDVHCTAWIDLGDGAPRRRCIISDVSASGARLAVGPGLPLPEEFQIALSRDGRVRRRCRVVWRETGEVGVRYLARPTWDFTV
jgi:hypothetical protein